MPTYRHGLFRSVPIYQLGLSQSVPMYQLGILKYRNYFFLSLYFFFGFDSTSVFLLFQVEEDLILRDRFFGHVAYMNTTILCSFKKLNMFCSNYVVREATSTQTCQDE